MPEAASLPLFPLHTVLVPGAALELRIFERRYLDMVRDCGRGGSGFGVCLILDGDVILPADGETINERRKLALNGGWDDELLALELGL